MFPTRLKIGGHIWKIDYVGKSSLSDDSPCGHIDRETGIITINKHLTNSCKQVTLLHEIIHAINFELNEELTDSLAEQLYQVLKDNKLTF